MLNGSLRQNRWPGIRRVRPLGGAVAPRVDINGADRTFRVVTGTFGVLVVLVLAVMGLAMVRASLPTIRRFGWQFLFSQVWDPLHEQFGALPFIFGTVASSILALIIAVPLSLGVAISLSELVPAWARAPLGFVVELLAAIPSVVYGLWGIFVLVPWLRESVQPPLADVFGFLPLFGGIPNGYGMMAAGVILAIMIVPTIAAVSRDVLRAVPLTQREAALALGATRWEAIRVAVLPYARSGVVGAVLLGLGRALGETMAVTMVIGNRSSISTSLFNPAATMASVIANEYSEATSDLHLAALSELGLILFGVGILLNVFARLLVWRVAKAPARAAEI
jgi:phosphate transport system permease protein